MRNDTGKSNLTSPTETAQGLLFPGHAPAATALSHSGPDGSIPGPVLALCERLGRPLEHATGRALFTAGSPVLGLHLILRGTVRIVRHTESRAIVVHRERAGGLLGEVALFGDGIYPGTAYAAEPTSTRLLPADAAHREIRRDPALAAFFLQRLARRTQEVIGRLDRLAHHTVLRRLAAHLLARVAAARPLRHGDTVSMGMSQVELAEELGTVKEVVVRELRMLRRLGLIAPADRGRYRIVDAVGLASLADI